MLYGLQIAALNLPPHPRPHPLHERDEIPEPVTAIVTHPTHGPIAPAAELAPPPERRSLGETLMREFFSEEYPDYVPPVPPPQPPTDALPEQLDQPQPAALPVPDALWHPSVFAPADYQRVQQPIPEEDQQTTILPNLQATAEGDASQDKRVPHSSRLCLTRWLGIERSETAFLRGVNSLYPRSRCLLLLPIPLAKLQRPQKINRE